MKTTLLAFCLVAICAVPAAAQLTSSEQQKGVSSTENAQDERLQRYKEIWASARQKVDSGVIRYKQYSGNTFALRDHDKVRQVLNTFNEQSDHVAQMKSVARTLTGIELIPAERAVYFSGENRRYENSGDRDLIILNGDFSIRTRPVNDGTVQISIDKRAGGTRTIRGVTDFYSIPPAEATDSLKILRVSDTVQLKLLPNESWLIRGALMSVDRHGDVLEISTGDPKNTGSEQLYYSFTECDGVRLPKVSVSSHYYKGELAMLQITVLVEAKFHFEIDGSVFVQNAKAGDVIIDNRNGKEHAKKLTSDLDDVTQIGAIAQ